MNRIKALMDEKKWTVYRLGKEAGFKAHHRLARIVNSPEIPSTTPLATLKRIAKGLGVKVSDLIQEESPPNETIIVMEGEIPISWNEFYAGKINRYKRASLAADTHQAVRAFIDPDWPMYKEPVEIRFDVYFKDKRSRLDWSNVTAKLYEDGLISWLIPDDNPDFVKAGHVYCHVDKERPRTEIRIYPANGL